MTSRNKYDNMSWRQLTATRTFRAVVITVLNVVCIFRVDLRTMIPLLWLFVILIAIGVIGFLVYRHKLKRTRNESLYMGWCVFPGIFHFLLLLNLLNTFHPYQETYGFSRGQETIRRRTVASTYIYLDGGAYADYPGIRVFVDRSQINGDRTITYTFATGLLGITVMKDWEFH